MVYERRSSAVNGATHHVGAQGGSREQQLEVADLRYVARVPCSLCIVLTFIANALLKVDEVDGLLVSTQHPLTSLTQATVNLRAISTPKTSVSLNLRH